MMLFAEVDTKSRTFFEFAPLISITEWWHLLIASVVVLLVVVWIVAGYIFDGVELSRPLSWTLSFLRVAALVGLIVFFVNLEKRSAEKIVHNSRIALMVDTSLSMSLQDTGQNQSRIDEVIRALTKSSLIADLQVDHDVIVYRFDEESRAVEVATFSKTESAEPQESIDLTMSQAEMSRFDLARNILYIGAGLLIASILFALFSAAIRLLGRTSPLVGWSFALSVVLFVGSTVTCAVSDLTFLPADLQQIAGLRKYTLTALEETSESTTNQRATETNFDWEGSLQAGGTKTRMGDALRFVVNKEREGAIAGVVLITDGCNNTGIDYRAALGAARDAGIPVYTIGAGSNAPPRNIRVVDVKAPSRVYPGDKFKFTGLIQSFGFMGENLEVYLMSTDEDGLEDPVLEATSALTVTADGKPEPVTFELQRDDEGIRIYNVVLAVVPGETSEDDNADSVQISFVDKKQHVLLVAGGPSRDYRFLRNHLFRDPKIISHVYLQTAGKGADQEGDETIFEFPKTRDEWFAYDCIVAFDPDWRKLNSNQAKWLKQWVSEKAGGLIVITGPVNTPEWTRRGRGDDAIDIIRQLYPVSFYNQDTAVVKLGRFGGEQGFPLEYSRAGRASEFLWLAETGSASHDIWQQYRVYGYYAVSEAKPGAEIFSWFSDEETSINGELPIYMAGHFYGSGRVFFQASGEMWRMRRNDPSLFDEYYVKLIRWASQGRLTRDSTRGLLLVDKPKAWIGDQVSVQAILRDAQDQPLAYRSVIAAIAEPGEETGTATQVLELQAINDGTTGGTYSAQLTTKKQGKYRISLPIPDSPDNEVLTVEVTASIPDLEIEQPQRNDAALQDIAGQTKGHYFENINLAIPRVDSPGASDGLLGMVLPRDQETYLPGTTDQDFSRRMFMWVLGIFTLVLCLEWTFRRLNRLA